MKCSEGLSNRVSNVVRKYVDLLLIWLFRLSHSFMFLLFPFFIVAYMFCMLLFNFVNYVFLLLRLCILIVMFMYYCYVCSVLYIVFSLCCSVYCLCVNVYCTTVTGCQPSCKYIIKYHQINLSVLLQARGRISGIQ